MRGAILIVCAGIASGLFVGSQESLALLRSVSADLLLFLSPLLLLLYIYARHLLVLRVVIAAIALFIAGLYWHIAWAESRLAKILPIELEGRDLSVEGVVASLPERGAIAQQFQFAILHSEWGFHPRRVTLNYYGEAVIAPGQRWQFTVRLNRPHGFANPGGFDYEGWLFQQGISARGYVRESGVNRLLAEQSGWELLAPAASLHEVRSVLRDRLLSLAGDAPNAGLLVALVVGDRSGITQDNWELFSATGSNHLFVISGLHIGLISGFCYFLCLLLCRLLPLAKTVPTQKIAALAGLIAAFVYALLAGFSLPTQRAFIMLAVLMLGLFVNARYLLSFRLLLALLVVLLLNPLAPLGSGFWLSFVAVSALLAFVESPIDIERGAEEPPSANERFKAVLSKALRPQLIVLLALSLPLLFFTQQLSLLAPIVNVMAIPLVGFVVVPLSFAALLLSMLSSAAGSLCLALAHAVLSLLLGFMQALLAWGADALLLQFPRFSSWEWIGLFVAVLLILFPRAVSRRSLLLPLCLPLLPLPPILDASKTMADVLRVHIIDVGQGLAVIVQTSGHALLYDSGANLSPDFNLGSAVVVPALRAIGISRLDAVVISHGDNDHAGGLSGVSANMNTGTLISHSASIEPHTEVTLCHGFDAWNWDGVTFRFLDSGIRYGDENNNSCVLQILFGDVRMLLPGDIERTAELDLVRRYGRELDGTVLVAPHHGSLTSSSYAFLKHVKPKFVVFASGYRNSFGHPHPEVVARYANFTSRALNTSEAGMISFELGEGDALAGEVASLTQYRLRSSRYWR